MPCRFLRFDLGTFIHSDLLKIAAFDSNDSGLPCCFAMRLRWPSKQTTRSILVVLHRQCGMPIRRCLCCRRHSIFLLESSRVGEHLPEYYPGIYNSRFCVCLVVSLKVLEVVLGSVCLLLVRLAAFGYDMMHAVASYVNQFHLKLMAFLKKLNSIWGWISFRDDFASFQSTFSSWLTWLGLILAYKNYMKSPLLRSIPFQN